MEDMKAVYVHRGKEEVVVRMPADLRQEVSVMMSQHPRKNSMTLHGVLHGAKIMSPSNVFQQLTDTH